MRAWQLQHAFKIVRKIDDLHPTNIAGFEIYKYLSWKQSWCPLLDEISPKFWLKIYEKKNGNWSIFISTT